MPWSDWRAARAAIVSLVVACSACGAGSGEGPSADAGSQSAAGTSTAASKVTIAGFAFVDSSVTGQGSRAKLPPGARIFPPGSTITGTDGCPTNRYRTDGLPVAVIDHEGRPTAASLTIVETRGGRRFPRAPYYLDLDTGRKLQFLGPIVDNGTYEIEVAYGLTERSPAKVSATFVLDRTCG
jgi:hypothetical protein